MREGWIEVGMEGLHEGRMDEKTKERRSEVRREGWRREGSRDGRREQWEGWLERTKK